MQWRTASELYIYGLNMKFHELDILAGHVVKRINDSLLYDMKIAEAEKKNQRFDFKAQGESSAGIYECIFYHPPVLNRIQDFMRRRAKSIGKNRNGIFLHRLTFDRLLNW